MGRDTLLFYARHLEHFLNVMNHRSLRSAAEAARITQPGLSKSISTLESKLGVSLFERTSKGVEPSEAALILERHAKIILADFRYAEMNVNWLKNGVSGSLKIGAGLIWSLGLLPQLIANIQTRYPGLTVEVHSGIGGPLLEEVTTGDIDIFLGTLHERTDVIDNFDANAELLMEPILEAKRVAFVRESHPLLATEEIQPRDTLEYPWAGFCNDTHGDTETMEAFRKLGLDVPDISLRTNSIAALLSIVAQTNHIVLLADILESEALNHGLKRLSCDIPTATLKTWLVMRQNLLSLKPVLEFCEAVRNVTAERPVISPSP